MECNRTRYNEIFIIHLVTVEGIKFSTDCLNGCIEEELDKVLTWLYTKDTKPFSLGKSVIPSEIDSYYKTKIQSITLEIVIQSARIGDGLE